ncbi:hypothetical protein ACMA1D_17995 [Streptomyces sp. 796.1]
MPAAPYSIAASKVRWAIEFSLGLKALVVSISREPAPAVFWMLRSRVSQT